MKSYLAKSRLVPLVLIFGMILLIFCGVLYNTQILNGSDYKARSLASSATAQTVEASRGIITDRNGKVLISNRLTYTLVFSDEEFESDTDCNDAIFRLLELCRSNNVKWTDTLPVSKEPPFTYTTPTDEGAFREYLESEDLPAITVGTLRPTQEAPLFMAQLRKLYGVADSYSDTDARAIIGVRYQLALRDIAGGTYTFASDVSVELINQVVDGRYAGVTTGTASARVYDTTYAAHVLGRLSPIYQEDWVGDPDNGIVGYRDKGYSMDALVGESGVEKAFEEYLHGENGTKLITTTSDGQITGEFYTKEPKPGNTVALTLDIDLQEDVEKALSKTIGDMTEKDGIRRGGAAVVVGVGSGEVLALASYPTYDISKWDEIYDTLASDDKGAPLFNRAIGGTYAPGSTFKPCTAVAALESGVITPSTTILDRGIYDYYSSPQPRCWIYSSYGSTHGRVDVSEAITVSCNYFFYEVGRLTGIKTLDDYATQFGLGQYTGIEIGGPNSAEAKGALASPEYAEANDLEWSDGQTLTAAIGQSYNLFTPLQLANYIATLVGNGEHYAAHLLKNVKTYNNSAVVYAYDKDPVNVVEMQDSTVEAIKTGMHDLTTGSLSTYFSKCVVSAGAKTGTAETGVTDANNGTFVCFAPYDDPQIAVAVVIEKGGAGAALAETAVDILNAYFSREEIGTAIIVLIQAVPSAVYYLYIQMYGTTALGVGLLFDASNWKYWVLPVCSMSLGNIAFYAMWLRRYMVDESNKDYVRLARAKGVSENKIALKHIFRNAMVPLVQYIPSAFLNTVVGSIYIESLYSIPGMGGLLVTCVQRHDNTMVQGIVLLYACVGIIGLILGDVLMVLIDPRINFGKKEGGR